MHSTDAGIVCHPTLLPRRPGTLFFLRKDAKRSGAEFCGASREARLIRRSKLGPFHDGEHWNLKRVNVEASFVSFGILAPNVSTR